MINRIKFPIIASFTTNHIYSVYPNIRTIRCVESILGNLHLAIGEEGVSENEGGGYFGPKDLFLACGFILSSFGFMLPFKIIDYVYLDLGFNVNVAVGGFFLALAIFMAGGFLFVSHL